MNTFLDKYILAFVLPLGAAMVGWSAILGRDSAIDASLQNSVMYFLFFALVLLVFSGILALHRQVTLLQGISIAISLVMAGLAGATRSESFYKLFFIIIAALMYSLMDAISRFTQRQKITFAVLSYLFVVGALHIIIGATLQSLPWPIAWLIIFSLLPYLACFALVKASDHFPLTKL